MSNPDDKLSMAPDGWTCFHCGTHFGPTFQGWQEALHHFGDDAQGDAYCQMTARQVRAMQDLLRQYQEEDTALHRHIVRLESDHLTALRREEEKGYARGLRDAGSVEPEHKEDL